MALYVHFRDGSPDILNDGPGQIWEAFFHASPKMNGVLTPDVITYHNPSLEQRFDTKCTSKCKISPDISIEWYEQ